MRQPAAIRQNVRIASSGSVEPRETAELAFQVAGRVQRVLVEEGAGVRKGQLLAELDPTDYKLGLEAAIAQAGMARAALEKAEAGARAQELERARVAFEQAADEYRRMKQLAERKALAPIDFQKIEARYRAVQAQYEEAREGARREDKAAARAALAQAQAGEAAARKRLDDTALRSPLDGVVARRGADPGEMVAAGMPVFVVLDLEPAKVRVGVPESDIGLVRLGQPAEILIPALPGQTFQGTVESVGPAAEPTSRTYPVRIRVPNPKRLLRAGMIAEARIQGDAMIEALTLPGETVVRDPQGATLVYVFFPAQQRVYARRVAVGTVYGQEVEIKSGLAASDLVVVAGQQLVREGATVEVQREGR